MIKDEPGFACVQNEGAFLVDSSGAVARSFSSAVPDSAYLKSKACCMRVPYLMDGVFTAMVNATLGDKLRGSGDPAHRLQAFNGYGVIGMTEKKGVGAFRYGLKMSSQPQYGAQGMDFILNSFMNNLMIRSLVAQAESDYGNHPKNLVCAGKTPGTYAVDSDKYVNQQRAMKRLSTVIGKDWLAMTGLQRGLVRHEYEFVNDLKGQDHSNLSGGENARFQAAIDVLNSKSDESAKWEYYRTNVYPFRDPLGKTSMRSWSRLDDNEVLEIRRKIPRAPAQD